MQQTDCVILSNMELLTEAFKIEYVRLCWVVYWHYPRCFPPLCLSVIVLIERPLVAEMTYWVFNFSSMCSSCRLNKRCYVVIINFWRFVTICVSGLRLRASVWRRFSLRLHLWPIISLVTPPLTTNTWLKTCSTVTTTTRQPITPLKQPTAPWHLMAPQSDLHPATAQAQIQFRRNLDWTVRSWTRQRGSASWGPNWALRAVGVRDRHTLLRDTAVRTTQTETLMWKYICWTNWWTFSCTFSLETNTHPSLLYLKKTRGGVKDGKLKI